MAWFKSRKGMKKITVPANPDCWMCHGTGRFTGGIATLGVWLNQPCECTVKWVHK